MKQSLGFNGIVFGGAAVLMAIQPALAAPVQVTGVRLNPTPAGVDIVLQTQNGDRPQVFAVNRGGGWTADITNSQLRVPGGTFRQDNPATGISSITIAPLDANSIRVTVVGQGGVPTGQVVRPTGGGLVLSVSRSGGTQAGVPPAAQPPIAQPPSQPPLAQVPPPAPLGQVPPPLVPNPRITTDPAFPTVNPNVPPLQPRAVAPPVGDIAVSQVNSAASTIDLGTAERVPRLVLRDAPAREVLSLLARAAGLNLAYTGATTQPGQPGAAGQAAAAAQGAGNEGPRVTLDIENEPLQNVFNYVLQITGLEANLAGRTVFVGPRLPDDARNVVTRTLRMNQVAAGAAASFLASQGAEARQPFQRERVETIGSGNNTREIIVREAPQIVAVEVPEGRGPLLLRGLSVVTDERLNTVTMVGNPRKVEIATALLTQLDARRRQVVVNVKIVDVNLLATEDFNTSFSFGVGDSFFSVDGGAALFNFGGIRPPTNSEISSSLLTPPVTSNFFPQGANLQPFVDAPRDGAPFGNVNGARPPFGTNSNPFAPGATDIQPPQTSFTSIGNQVVQVTQPGRITYALPSLFQFPSRFLARLQAQVQSGNAKILTDPTLTIQEGERASVNLTSEVFGGIEVGTDGQGNTFRRPIIKSAGLILPIQVQRIDDNGFISMTVTPEVNSVGGSSNVGAGEVITLLNQRRVQSGLIRVRDGQTLILAGIIQDSDRATVTKVPILGDIPILGALFRRTNRLNERQEVIVLLTPKILDDSNTATFGYGYTPSPGVRQLLDQQNNRFNSNPR